MRMCVHPKSSSEVKNDWLVVAMQATEGSRNAECGASQVLNVECGMWNDLLLWSVLHTRTHISRYVLTDSICCCATRYATSLLDMICSLFLTSRFAEAKHLVSAGHIVPARAIVRPRGAYRREENYRFLRLAQFSWLD